MASTTETSSTPKGILIALFLTVFLDLLGGGLVIPILPSILLDVDKSILDVSVLPDTRTLIFGFLTGTFFIAQFLGAPILGAISDRDGRKKVLLMSLGGTVVGYFIFALGIYLRSIEILFFSRFLAGFMGGNISVALSCISDISDSTNKTRNFGLIGAAFGLGFIFGPFLGSVLSEVPIIPHLPTASPFIVAGLLTIVNIVLVIYNLPETLKVKQTRAVTMFTGFQNIATAFSHPKQRIVFLTVFAITFGFSLFTQFFSVFLTRKFNMQAQGIGMLFAYIGVWSVIAQAAILRPLTKRFSPLQILSVSLLSLSVLLVLIVLPTQTWVMYFIIPFIAVSQGMTQPNINTIVTSQVSEQEQGQVLGINQSVQSIAMGIPPFMAGYLSNMDLQYPNFVAALSMAIGWAILFFILKKK